MTNPDLLCLSHLRWNFVFQRPQHLMTRFAAERRVYFLEEPVFGSTLPFLDPVWSGAVCVLTPQLPAGVAAADADQMVRRLLRSFLEHEQVHDPLLWFYTPMMLPLAKDLRPSAVVYDCMDELSGFAGAPPELRARERALMEMADLVFTGGQSIYEAKRAQHANAHPFPSSVDVPHFARALRAQVDPEDQAGIGGPRIGYCGVIDERMDLDLIRGVAALRPDWHLVMVGPVAKISPEHLPQAPNIHYLGMKTYEELPRYLAGWDVAMLPFARNAATRFISPTKTPEYLAAGRPVISTSVRDVVRPYGEQGMVRIADTPEAFVDAATLALAERKPPAAAERYVAAMSWDRTWSAMNTLVEGVVRDLPAPVTVRVSRVERQQPAATLRSALTGEA